jgi:hypothetical protein
MTMSEHDRLAEIRERRARVPALFDRHIGEDLDWLVGECERLRTIIADIDKLGCATIAMQRDWTRDDVDRLRDLLARLEWAGGGFRDDDFCPACRASQSIDHAHNPGCELARELYGR